MNRLLNEPVALGNFIESVVAVAVLFTDWTVEQKAGAMGVAKLVSVFIQRALVTPNHLAEARVAAGGSPTEPMKK